MISVGKLCNLKIIISKHVLDKFNFLIHHWKFTCNRVLEYFETNKTGTNRLRVWTYPDLAKMACESFFMCHDVLNTWVTHEISELLLPTCMGVWLLSFVDVFLTNV